MGLRHLHQLNDWANHRYRTALDAAPEDEDLVRLYVGLAFALGNLEQHLERRKQQKA